MVKMFMAVTIMGEACPHPLSTYRLPTYGKKEACSGIRFAESEHEMRTVIIIPSIPTQMLMLSRITVPIIPGSPMAVIVVLMSSMLEVSIMAATIERTLPVTMITVEIPVAILGGNGNRYGKCKKTKHSNDDPIHLTPLKTLCNLQYLTHSRTN